MKIRSESKYSISNNNDFQKFAPFVKHIEPTFTA
jgi:hypothetical protein